MTIAEAQKEYNKLLKRYKDANVYFEREDIPQAEKEKFLPNFQKILTELSYLLSKVGIYAKEEALEGFHER